MTLVSDLSFLINSDTEKILKDMYSHNAAALLAAQQNTVCSTFDLLYQATVIKVIIGTDVII
jgi:hypothetical protein